MVDAPMAVVAVDAAGTVRSSNCTADAYFGQPLSGGVQISTLLPGLDVAALETGPGLEAFNALSRSAGDRVHLQANRNDRPPGLVDVQAARFSARGEDFLTLFIQDVTSVVAAEAAVQDLRQQIIYNWRLNSLGEMASMVAHELNQPLSAILNFLDAARTLVDRPEIDRAKVLKFIESAGGQAERAGDVIRRLRTLMARDTGFHTQVHVAEVIDEIVPILHMSAREHDAAITVRIPPDDVTCCDRVQIQQIIFNLVRNALDAPTHHERRQVVVSGGPTPDGYRIVVEDNGPGVAETVAAGLFDPLSSSKPGGMGLGLSICKTIVEAHNGTIAYSRSALGGAAFAFTLNDGRTNV
ncbi:PAS domain-containing sensor histidine kinase [Brevundimonas sp. LM2]|nr:PAS domain-containing sensor histidine kinase [Brevundimonas sp. LM2]